MTDPRGRRRRGRWILGATLAGLSGLALACGIESSGLLAAGDAGGPDVGTRDALVVRDGGKDATQETDSRPSSDVVTGHDEGVDSSGGHADSGHSGHDAGIDGGHDAGVDAGRPPRDAASGSDATDACTMYCNPPDTIVTDSPTTVCVSGGCDSAQDLACPAGQALIGVTGSEFSDNAMAKLAAVCGTIGVGGPSGFAARTTVTVTTSSIGQGGATMIAANCPSGSAVTGFSQYVGGSEAVFAFTLDCSPIAVDYTAPGTYGITVGSAGQVVVGGSGGTGGGTVSDACGSGQVASGLEVSQETIVSAVTVIVPRPYGLDCSNLSFP